MHVSVFAYTLLASITLRFSISTKKCSTLLVSDNHISYSGYITPVPGKWNEFHINQSSQALLEYNVCYKFQFIYIQIPEYTFKFIFPDVTPMLVTVRYIPLYQFRLRKACYFDMEGSHYRPNWLDSMFETEGIISINSFRVEFCGPLQYSHLQIITLPCKIPCPSIIREIYCSFSHVQANELWEDSANITCDVCNNVYMFCKNIHLRSKSLPLIRIISKVCKYAILQMWTYDLGQFSAMVTFSRNDFLSATSAFTTDTDIFLDISSCVAEIPIRVTKLVKPNAHRETTRHVKTFQWGGALYHSVRLKFKVSWETAAFYCQESGAFLLTIHSQAEYLFLRETFLKTYGVLVLYVGVKRKVIWIYNFFVDATV